MITCPYDWLLIRATKDQSPTPRRLRRIWSARCMLEVEYTADGRADQYIAERLRQIAMQCEGRRDWWEAIEDAAPESCWKIGVSHKELYWTRIMLAMASIIRLTEVRYFPNYRSPARFRPPNAEVSGPVAGSAAPTGWAESNKEKP